MTTDPPPYGRDLALIGMVHTGPLPGAPLARESIDELATRAAREAAVLQEAGFDAVLVENMHDRPYLHDDHGPETTAAMVRITQAVREACTLPVGVQILSGGSREALAVALACGGSFIRCENFVFAHVADEGLLARAEAGPLLRYRRQIGAEHVAIFCDIKKKHASHAVTHDLSLAETAEAAEFFGADGLIVSGQATARPTDPNDVLTARRACGIPVLVGSGVRPESVGPLFEHANALIVGSWIKHEGLWHNPPDPARCREIVSAADAARASQ